MKRVFIIALLGLLGLTTRAQYIPPASNPVCAYCGVSLTSGESHKSGCPYYEAPNDEQESQSASPSTSSTHLRDHEPLPEVKSTLDVPSYKYELLYQAGDGEHMVSCPSCGSVAHERGCMLAGFQRDALNARAKALAATTREAREAALREFHAAELSLNRVYENALAEYRRRQEQAPQQSDSPAPGGYQHLTSADIKGGYDKKLGFDSWATAYGKTLPNGEEQWVLYDQDGNEVGQFSKVETAQVPNGLDVFVVRDHNGKWGVYNAGGYAVVRPEYESVKVLVALQQNESREFYDVTLRDERGQLRHGIISGAIADADNRTIPCVCERIELLDRSPATHGVLAKVTVDGRLAVIDADTGEVLIQPYYSYINTYFTPRGMYLIVGDGVQFGAYFAETLDLVVAPNEGKSIDQVRNILDQIK
jgi:hypothetical protein